MITISAYGLSRFRLKAATGLLLLLTGCATPSPTGTSARADSGPRPLSVNGASTTIEVTRIALDQAQGSSVAASDLGPDCASPRARAFDPMTTLLAPLDSLRAVRGTLQDYGYVAVSGGGQQLFNDPDARAGLQIGAVIAEIALETCGPRGDGLHTQGTGRLRLVLDWQVFAPSQRQVVYATRTVGEARVTQETPFLEATLYTAALREATRWLLSDPQFVTIAAPRARETQVYRGWRETYYYQPPIIVPDYGPYWSRYPIYRPDYLFYDPFFYRPYPPRVIVVPDRRYDRDRDRDYDRDRRRREAVAPAPQPPASPTPIAPTPETPPVMPPILGPDGQPLPIDLTNPPPVPPDVTMPPVQPAPMPEAELPAPMPGGEQPRRRRGAETPNDRMPEAQVPAPMPAPAAPLLPTPQPNVTPAPMPEPIVPAPQPQDQPFAPEPRAEPRFKPAAPAFESAPQAAPQPSFEPSPAAPSFEPSPQPMPSPAFEPAPQPREEPRFERFEPPPQPREEPRFEPAMPRNDSPFGGNPMGGASPGNDPFGGVELPNCSPDLPPGVPCR